MQKLFRMEHPPKNTTGVLKLNPGEQNFPPSPNPPPPPPPATTPSTPILKG